MLGNGERGKRVAREVGMDVLKQLGKARNLGTA